MNSNNKSVTSNIGWKFAERGLAQIVSFFVSIVLARVLLPKDYGMVTMVTIFITFLDVLVTNGLPIALIQKKDADSLDFSSVFYFNIIFSIVLYLLVYCVAPSIAAFYSNEALIPIIRVMGTRIIIASVNSVQHSFVSKNMMFKKYFWSTLFGTILSAIIGICLALKGTGAWALVAQYMTNTIVDTVVLWFTVKWRPEKKYSWKRVYCLISFGWKILFEAISETFSTQFRNLLIGKVYSSADLAFYNKAQQFPNIIINNISTSISSVLFPAMSNKQDESEFILVLLRKSTRLASYVLFPMMIGLGIVADPLIRLLLTEKWIECVPYLRIFCFTQGATIGMTTRHQALLATGRSDVYMIEHIAYRIFFLGLVILVYKHSVMAIALTGVAGSIFMMITVMYTSYKFNNYRIKDQICDLIPIIISCILMSVPVYFVNLFKLPNIVKLFLQVPIGGIIYIICSIVFKIEEFAYCKSKLYSVIKLGRR